PRARVHRADVDRVRHVAVSRRRGRAAGESTAGEIRSVALDLFYKHGFQATTLRHIASRVGIQVGSLYNHITSKGELLFDIMETVMQALLEDQGQVAQEPRSEEHTSELQSRFDLVCRLLLEKKKKKKKNDRTRKIKIKKKKKSVETKVDL